MVDEDFVMGYACGYNDGIGSGGGSSGEPFSEIVIEKNYPFGDSGYGVATLDFKKSHCYRQSLASYVVANPGGITPYRTVWGPVDHRIYLWTYAMTKGGKTIGLVASDISLAVDNEGWSYETGEWVKISEDCPVIGKCSVILSSDSTEYKQTYQMVVDVDGAAETQTLATRQMNNYGWSLTHFYGHAPHLMDDTEFAAWFTAFVENGITL